MIRYKFFELVIVLWLEGNEKKMQNRRRLSKTKLFMLLFAIYRS